MAIVNIAQRTDEWFDWRKTGITASMIPVILGLSPYQTPYELWAELCGFKQADDLSNNYHVQRGIAQEPEARKWYEESMGRPYLPVCVEADHNTLFKASLDGLFGLTRQEREVLEVKCPCAKIFDEIASMQGNAPTFKMYAAQVQWQLNCGDSNKGKLFFYLRGRKPIGANIQRNDAFIARAEEEALKFWQLVQDRVPPELIEGRDKVIYHKDGGDEWDTHSAAYREVSREMKELEEKLSALKAKAKEHESYFQTLIPNDAQTFTKDGIRITKVDRDGAIDYKKLIDLIQNDFSVVVTSEMYKECQKSSSTSYRYTLQNKTAPETDVQQKQPEKAVQVEQSPTPKPVDEPAQAADPKIDSEKPQQPLVIAVPRAADSYFKKATQSMYF